MGKLHKFTYYFLGLLCSSLVAFQALGVESTARVSTSIDAASGYRGINNSTVRAPAGATVRPLPSVAIPDTSKMANGGIQQVMRGTVSIDGVKDSQPINMRVRATVPTLKSGAKSLLKGGLIGIGLTVGLEALLDGIDALIEDGQVVRRIPNELTEIPEGASFRPFGGHYVSISPIPSGHIVVGVNPQDSGYVYICSVGDSGRSFIGYSGNRCYYMANANPEDGFSTEPIPESQLDIAVDELYEPEPEDWPLLSPHIEPDDIEIYDLPGTMYGEPQTVTVSDPAGNPQTVTVTQPAYNLEPRNNPSPQPALDLNIDVETRTYNEHGELTGISTASSTAPAGAGGGEPPDIPTDCAFMPTICAFLEWFQEPDPELNNEPDLSVLRDDLEIERDFDVGASTAACPAPIQISFAMFPSTELSFQPLCDFVDLLRPLVLMLAFFFSASIILRS